MPVRPVGLKDTDWERSCVSQSVWGIQSLFGGKSLSEGISTGKAYQDQAHKQIRFEEETSVARN